MPASEPIRGSQERKLYDQEQKADLDQRFPKFVSAFFQFLEPK
jgi:hypothetical protein